MSPSVDTKHPPGHVSDSEATRISDDVVSWVKTLQISVGKAGDQILEDLRCKSQAGVQGTKFIKNEEFLRSITTDKIGFLQEQKDKFSIEDYSLDLATPVTNLTPNAEVKCKIVMKKPSIGIPPMKVSLLNGGKEVHKIAQSDLPLFTLPVLEPGDYEVHATLQGRHVLGSPLSLPVSTDSTIRDRLAMLGLAPLNAKEFVIGTKCFAKWSEDGCWYNAVVEKIVDSKYQVTFTDYGNGDQLEQKDLRLSSKDIPPTEEIDENVSLSNNETTKDEICKEVKMVAEDQNTFSVGENVLTKWSEDETWYNAKILSVSGSKFGVNFVDYGNDAEEKIERILKLGSQIPEGDLVDELVKEAAATPDKDLEPKVVQPTISKPQEQEAGLPSAPETSSKEPPASSSLDIKVGDMVIGKWAEDNVWYNAKVLKVDKESATVLFVDYGNEEEVKLNYLVRTSSEIPDSEEIDENVKTSAKPDLKKEVTQALNPSTGPIAEAKEVQTSSCKFKEGDQVIAQWSEDGVWYNAKIIQMLPEHVKVLFVDYGNEANVEPGKIVLKVEDIPAPRDIDENVANSPTKLPTVETKVSVPPPVVTDTSVSESVNNTASFKVGDRVFAKWAEDQVWYNAKVEAVHVDSYQVLFVDYGNSEKVTMKDVVATSSEIPTNDDYDEHISMSSKEQVSDSDPIKEVVKAGPKIGDLVFAKWAEDEVWYNAKVLNIHSDHLEVEFVDYGNTDKVTLINVVKIVEDIPKVDEVDEHIGGISTEVKEKEEAEKVVSTEDKPLLKENISDKPKDMCNGIKIGEAKKEPIKAKSPQKENVSAQINDQSNGATHVVGDLLFAKWSEDGVWYNAKILNVHSDHLEVEFVDYGNTDKVTLLNVVKDVKDIPETDDFDANVKGIAVAIQKEEDILAPIKSDAPKAETKEDEKMASNIDSSQSKSKDSPELRVGSSCVARWSEDQIWYNAKILSVTESGFNVHFVDYGNDADVTTGEVFSHEDSYKVPPTETVDENVKLSVQPQMSSSPEVQTASSSPVTTEKVTQDAGQKTNSKVDKKEASSTEKKTNVEIGEVCFAKWGEDSVWYNSKVVEVSSSGSITVEFIDYGNTDKVIDIVKKAQDIPKDSQIDDHVLTLMSSRATRSPSPDGDSQEDSGVGDSVLDHDKASFLNFVDDLTARKRLVIKDLNGPTGVAVLDEDTIAVVSRNDNKVSLFSKTGNALGQLSLDGRGKLSRPSDICALKTGECLVRDGHGIHMWDKKRVYQGRLGEANHNKYFGCGESDDHLITINCNIGSEVGPGITTDKGKTDVFFFDKKTQDIAIRLEMEDIIYKSLKVNSECRYLNYDNNRLFIVDMGLHYIYCLEDRDGWGGTLLGGNGKGIGQLHKPAGLVFDAHGNAMVVDSGNNRLQVLDTNLNFCGVVKVDRPLVRPSGIFMDRESSELYVSNYGDSSVVCYVLDKLEEA